MNNRYILIAGGIVIAAVLIGAIVFLRRPGASEGMPVSVPQTATSTKGPGYTIEVAPSIPLPDLNRKIQFGASVPEDARVILQKQFDTAVANLKKNSSSAEDWFNLALYYHEADDFEGARLVWEFLTKAAPNNSVAFENLGKLYEFDLKNYPKAEMYFKEAIAADSKVMDPYMELYELYLYSYKQDTTAAVDILNKAAAAFPKSSDPYYALGTYYEGKGDSKDARTAFNKAMDRARAANDVAAIKRIGDELSKLPQ